MSKVTDDRSNRILRRKVRIGFECIRRGLVVVQVKIYGSKGHSRLFLLSLPFLPFLLFLLNCEIAAE